MVGVGVGVSNGTQASEVTRFADLVIVGSALVGTLLDAEDAGRPEDLTQLRALVADLAAGVRASHITDEATLTPGAESGTPQRSPGLVGT
jgi:tryptophan synthase alpha chain